MNNLNVSCLSVIEIDIVVLLCASSSAVADAAVDCSEVAA